MSSYEIRNEKLTVRASDEGAELRSVKTADGNEYLWQGSGEYWARRAPNLFPYVGRLTDGKYTCRGKIYEMPRHGFLKDSLLYVTGHNRTSVSFELKSNEYTKVCYPFDFIFQIRYELSGPVLNVLTTVKNTGSVPMYFALGAHPGFRVPAEEGLSFEDYYLEFSGPSAPDQVLLTDTGFVTGGQQPYELQAERRIPLRHNLFDHDAVILKNAPRTVTLANRFGKHGITVRYPDYKYIAFWHTPHTDAPFVCTEPWTSLPSRDGIIEDLACQEDLICLESGKTYENRWETEIT